MNLAAQLLSRSVANSIDYCREVLKLESFKGSQATTKFIRVFDEIFDLLNSNNKFGSWSKGPLTRTNTGYWLEVFWSASVYISNLSETTGKKIIDTRKRTGFLGFIFNMKSVTQIFENYVEHGPLSYLLTYKVYNQLFVKITMEFFEIKQGCV
jgi:hypothetical protein